MPKHSVDNNLARIRKSRGVGTSELARRVDVSRQTIHSIESGAFVPNTEVALRIARELEVAVDELFSLRALPSTPPEFLRAELLRSSESQRGQPVRICRVGQRWVGVPVANTPYFLPVADGVIRKAMCVGNQAELMVFAKDEAAQQRLLVAGCDPATSLLSHMVERISGVEVVAAAASSKLALEWLKEGRVHIAGSHLEDPVSGEFNVPFIRAQFPGEEIVAMTFAQWEEGLVVASGNRKRIRKAGDLARKGVRFVNREAGSGSRALLDALLRKAGVAPAQVSGYGNVAFGHLPAAHAVLTGEADACVATRSAARTFGLDFVPLHRARYDLVMRKRSADLPSVQAFLDVLQRAGLRRKLEMLAGYDTSQTGTLLTV